MTDAEFEAQRERVRALIAPWKELLVPSWYVTWEWSRDACKDDKSESDGYTRATGMRCYAQWEYAQATIIAFLPTTARLDDDDLEEMFVHELCHVIVNEMCETAKSTQAKHEERVATSLARAFVRVRDEGKLGPFEVAD